MTFNQIRKLPNTTSRKALLTAAVALGVQMLLGAAPAAAQVAVKTNPNPNPIAATSKSTALGAALDCMIQPHQVVQVGTAAAGVVSRLAVDRGDSVRRGQVVAHLNSNVERAALALARERAEQNGEVAAATGAQDLARRELDRATELAEENFVSRTYFERQRAEAQVAGGRVDQAQERRKLAAREVDLAVAQLSMRTIVSPLDGVVVERFVSNGEYVDQKPLLRIAAIDPLRVDALVPAAAFGQVQIGAFATVIPELFNRSEHTAVVKSVDRVIDAASNTFRVRLELPNPGGVLPAGLRCKVDLGLKPGQAGPAAIASPPVPELKIVPAKAQQNAAVVPGAVPVAATVTAPVAAVASRR